MELATPHSWLYFPCATASAASGLVSVFLGQVYDPNEEMERDRENMRLAMPAERKESKGINGDISATCFCKAALESERLMSRV